jgi:fucose permease
VIQDTTHGMCYNDWDDSSFEDIRMKFKAIVLLTVIYIAFIALGLPDALIGSGWNMIREDLSTSLGTLGLMTVTIYVFSILSTFNAPRLLRFFETKRIVFFSILFTGIALIAISRINSFYQMLFFALPLGAGAGAIDVSLNHYLATNYKASHMNYLHSFYGIGVTLGPSIMAYALNLETWRLGYVIVGSILVVISFFVLFSFRLWKKVPQEDRDIDHAHLTVKDVIKTPGALPSILIFLIYVHLESLGGVWIASYFFIIKSVSYAQAALFTTTFYLALTIGRLTSGFVSSKISPEFLIRIGSSLMLISGILMVFDYEQIWIYPMIVFLFGFGCAPVFPNMMFLNSIHFEKKKMSKIMSLQMGVGYMGFGLLTPFAGMIFDIASIGIYPYVLSAMGIVLIVLTQKYFGEIKHKGLGAHGSF